MSVAGGTTGSARPLWSLSLLAAAGLVLAAVGLLRSDGGSALPEGAVARVNGAAIRAERYERLLVALASDRRGELTDLDRRRVLDRMIEEELLVQRGLELGLARVDRRVRSDLVGAVIAGITSDADRRSPTDADLRALYEADRDFFGQPGRLRVRQIFFRVRTDAEGEAAAARARAAKRRLDAGEPLEAVEREMGDASIVALPDALLPAPKLQEYLGPTAARAALALEIRTPSEPVRSGTGFHVLEVLEREPARTPALETIEAQVRAEWVRREGDRALRETLDELRERADVVIAPELDGRR